MTTTAQCRCEAQRQREMEIQAARDVAWIVEMRSRREVARAFWLVDRAQRLRRMLWPACAAVDPQRIFARMTHRDRGRVFSSRPMRPIERIGEKIRTELHESAPPDDWMPPAWALDVQHPPSGRCPFDDSTQARAERRALAQIRWMIVEARAAACASWFARRGAP